MRCVRPDFTMLVNFLALRSSERSSCLSAGSSPLTVRSSAARWTADGKTSLDDCPMLTWSLACALPSDRAAMTSLAFMLDDVPDPVWKTSMGNCASCSPAATAAAAAEIASASDLSSLPRSALTCAAAPLMRPSQWITETGTVSPEMGKLSTAFLVSPPYSVFLGGMGRTLRPGGRAGSAEEGHQLARYAHGVVVGDEVPRAGQHAQHRVGQQVERLLGAAQRMVVIVVGPQEQHGEVEPRQQVEHLAARAHGQRAAQPCPRAREVGVAADVGHRVADEVLGLRRAARAERQPALGAERGACRVPGDAVEARQPGGARRAAPQAVRARAHGRAVHAAGHERELGRPQVPELDRAQE